MKMARLTLQIRRAWWIPRRAYFYRDLADAISRKANIRDFLDRAIANARLLDDRASSRILRAMAARLAEGRGTTLADLLRGIAPRSDQILLRAVDDAGENKVEALEACALAVEFQRRALRIVGLELMVPLVSIPIVGTLCVITADIIASVAKEAPPEVWTGFNGVVRFLAQSIQARAPLIAIAMVIGIALIAHGLPRWTGAARLKADRWPVFSLYRDYHAAVVLNALAMMIRSGKTLRESLEALRVSASPWLRWHMGRVIAALETQPSDYAEANAARPGTPMREPSFSPPPGAGPNHV